MLQAITETDASNRRIRRPAHLNQIAALCGEKVLPETIISLIQRFNADTWFDMTTPYNVDRKDICE